jgi:ribosomal protein S13
MRHLYNYPVRGQRTHTNAKTRKKLKKLVVTLKSIKKVYVQKKN